MSRSAFIDESKRTGFTLVGVVVEDSHVARLRAAMLRHLLPGQERLHFVKESHGRRSRILADVLSFHPSVVIACDVRTRGARQPCLEDLLTVLHRSGVSRLVVEIDRSEQAHDQRTIYSVARSRSWNLSYAWLPSSQEPALWAADAAAWCWSKGGSWRTEIERVAIMAPAFQGPGKA